MRVLRKQTRSSRPTLYAPSVQASYPRRMDCTLITGRSKHQAQLKLLGCGALVDVGSSNGPGSFPRPSVLGCECALLSRISYNDNEAYVCTARYDLFIARRSMKWLESDLCSLFEIVSKLEMTGQGASLCRSRVHPPA